MKTINKYLTFFFITVALQCLPPVVVAQANDCPGRLDSARMLYRNGFIDEIPQLLLPCMNDGFTGEQKLQAYNLLILTYLFDDRQADAEKQVMSLLNEFPSYTPDQGEPLELRYMLTGFKAVPAFSYGVRFSAVSAFPYVTFNNTASALPGEKDKVTTLPGYMAELSLSFALRHNIFIETGFGNVYRSFRFTTYPMSHTESSLTEHQNLLVLPLAVTIAGSRKGWKPVFSVGTRMDYLWKDRVAAQLLYTGNEKGSVSGSREDVLAYRNALQTNIYIASGLQRYTRSGYWYLQLAGTIGLTNQAKSNRPDYDRWAGYQLVEDNYRVHSLQVSAGYMFSKFKPRKIKK